jgi:hypothetical protein
MVLLDHSGFILLGNISGASTYRCRFMEDPVLNQDYVTLSYANATYLTSGLTSGSEVYHSQLKELNWADAGHTIDADIEMAGYDINDVTVISGATTLTISITDNQVGAFVVADKDNDIRYISINTTSGSESLILGPGGVGTFTASPNIWDVDGLIEGVSISGSNYYADGNEGQDASSFKILTNVQVAGATLQAKYRTVVFTDGILTSISAESNWTNAPV